jgi:hypothetical protein
MRFRRPWAGAFRLQEFYRRTPGALSPAEVAAIREAIHASPYLADTNLNELFEGTRGFSVTFHREALPDVVAAFPAFAPYLDRVLLPGCDTFVLNPLVVENGRRVSPHTDSSLSSFRPGIGCPAAVSVLYVQVPAGLVGGELRLTQHGRALASLVPAERALVVFRGDLTHEVTPVNEGAASLPTARISLVVEQYVTSPADRAAIPRLHMQSRATMAVAP